MLVTIRLSDDDAAIVNNTIERYRELAAEEEATGRAEFELFDLEDGMGNFQWLIERVYDSIQA